MIREKREVKRAGREEKSVGNKALGGAASKVISAVEEDTTESAPGIGGDEVIPSGCVSDYRSGDKTEVGAKADCASASGEPGLREALADEEEGEQQAEEGDEERPTGEVERHDPFADEDDNKENRGPQVAAPIVEPRVDDYPAEEWSVVDESNSGLGVDLLEEVFDFRSLKRQLTCGFFGDFDAEAGVERHESNWGCESRIACCSICHCLSTSLSNFLRSSITPDRLSERPALVLQLFIFL